MGKKALVTGATGFIGSRIADQLMLGGVSVQYLVRSNHDGLSTMTDHVIVGDIRDPAVARKATSGVDTVLHFAAAVHRRATEDEFRSMNVEGTRNIAQAAAANGVDHFVFASSVSVYGSGNVIFNEDSQCKPDTPYGRSKLMAEEALEAVAEETGMDATILRLSTVYGEGEPGNISRLIKAVAKYGPIVMGKGSNRKSMTYVGNVAALCSQLVRNGSPERVSVVNVADPEPYRLDSIVTAISRALGRPDRLFRVNKELALIGSWCLDTAAGLLSRHSPVTPDQVKKMTANSMCDVTKLQQQYGFAPDILLEEGMSKTVDWYVSNGGI
ncbi:MAG: NAD-dependent epimerase/dehydratase family protein [Firmicutes bacterium]|jgi:nucleoside-diphosphate-sugar epimerase|nr:NAD-dependent epimerase/dehydratase family protein [Bacillota bacterium]